ncbi:hypothetical protein EZS27_018397 [termite gut metagenome]|uniref:Uncharacterized protein n=1 Tax=termite gut metagenome TaxID=433724 RepID=A0A5J4RJ48_9ZZZZ
MNQEIINVVNQIANEISLLFYSILEDEGVSVNKKVGKNTLASSNLRKDFETQIKTGNSIVIDCLFNHYIDFIEKGRTPKYKKRPPIDALRNWALNNGISTDNHTLFAISNAIWRDGYAPRPIFSKLEELIEKKFENEWSLYLFTAIIQELNTYFNE